jgi:hypothetical protein
MGCSTLHPAVSVAGRWGTPLDQFKFAVPWRQSMKIIAMVEFPKHMMVELVMKHISQLLIAKANRELQ